VVRFDTWAAQWLDGKLNLRQNTLGRNRIGIRTHLLPTFGGMRLGRITRADVQVWVRKLNDQGLAPATVHKAYRILASILAEAVESRVIPESPCRRISLPRIPYREALCLTADEVEDLAAAIDRPYQAAVYLGCRWGELVGLKQENVDLVRKQVRIVGTLEEAGAGPVYVEETKTRSSRRLLSMPPFLADILAEHLTQAPANEFVFTGPEGGLLRRSNFRRRAWKPALVRAGLDPELRFHDLRHACAALLIAQGAHPKEIQARLGHSTITTTLNTYGHLWPTLGSQLDDKIEAVFHHARERCGLNVACDLPKGSGEAGSGPRPEAARGL
jgi:integrase